MTKKFGFGILALAVLAGCSSGGTETTSTTAEKKDGSTPLVVFSEANSKDPWRKVFDADTKSAADTHKAEFDYEMQDAGGDPAKQNNIVDTFMIKKPKVLLISPTEDSVQTSIDKAFDAGVPVIILDRNIKTEKYTCYVGGDNVEIGREAGEYVAKQLNGHGKVLMIQGILQVGATRDRKSGFMDVMKKNPGITVVEGDDCGYDRKKGREYMASFLQRGEHVDCVYAHNDEMAIGARLAWDSWIATRDQSKPITAPIFVGVDACQTEVVDMIKAGKLSATFKYPTPGPKGIEIAAEIIKGNKPKDRKIILPTVKVTKETADQYLKDNPNLAK